MLKDCLFYSVLHIASLQPRRQPVSCLQQFNLCQCSRDVCLVLKPFATLLKQSMIDKQHPFLQATLGLTAYRLPALRCAAPLRGCGRQTLEALRFLHNADFQGQGSGIDDLAQSTQPLLLQTMLKTALQRNALPTRHSHRNDRCCWPSVLGYLQQPFDILKLACVKSIIDFLQFLLNNPGNLSN